MIVSVLISKLASSCMVMGNRFPFSLDILLMERRNHNVGSREA
jgi:hypothetical protein